MSERGDLATIEAVAFADREQELCAQSWIGHVATAESAGRMTPLWMALAAVIPLSWSIMAVYFCVTLIIALIGWTELARE